MKNLLLILGFPLWFPLLVVAFSIIFSLYLVLWAVIISLIAISISLLISGIFAGVGTGIYFATIGQGITGFALIGCGILCVGLSIFTFYGSKALIILSKNIILGLRRR